MNPVNLQRGKAKETRAREAATSVVDREQSMGNRVWIFGFTAIAIVGALALGVAHFFPGQKLVDFPLWQLIVIVGILCLSGLMSGLSGFGFSAVGSSCLLFIPPKLGVPLLMALSTANQLMSVGQLREDMPKTWKEAWPSGAAPYVAGGVLGVPLGIWLLNHMPATKLMLVFGVILSLYSVYSLFKPAGLKTKAASAAASGITVGFIGGTVGGFTAFPGAAVVVWTGLKNLPKQMTRAIVQPYILVLQVMSLATTAYAYPAIFARHFWVLLAITMPIVLPGTIGGVYLYRRVSDVNFKRISLILLGLSGVGLLVKVLLK
jgi:uncharacterized membrane protein YfcA